MKDALLKILFWPLWRWITPERPTTAPVVVMGMPRSGTSLVSRLVHAGGIYFGEESWFRPADERNPDGFFELREMNKLDDRLVSESGFATHMAAETWLSLRALPGRRLGRMRTLYRMQRLLAKLSAKNKLWGFKEMPMTFYWWNLYVPKARIVGIYRDPIACADSIHRTFKRITFKQALDWWTRGNVELLYHLATHDSMLIRLEDLADPQARERVLSKLAEFCGADIQELLSATPSTAERHRTLPNLALPQETSAILEALNSHAA